MRVDHDGAVLGEPKHVGTVCVDMGAYRLQGVLDALIDLGVSQIDQMAGQPQYQILKLTTL